VQTQDYLFKSSASKQALNLCPVLVRLRRIEYGCDVDLVRHRTAFHILRMLLGVHYVHKPCGDQGLEGVVDLLI
jgi:hypothetical protein